MTKHDMNMFDPRHKFVTLNEMIALVELLRKQKKVVVTTNGCFDILHPGHTKMLEWARTQGDLLIVGINSDASVKRLKGPERPINNEEDRAYMLGALRPVDYVLIYDEDSPRGWLKRIRPDVHVKGGGSASDSAFELEKRFIESLGGTMRLAPFLEGHSTTKIVEQMHKRR
ncbi:MAG: adenylyltransferase/cytidyltransferase family protein [Patescibacteria group bacterium]